MLCAFCESSSSDTTRKHIIYLSSKFLILMRYFLLLCTILFLQVFMPSGRILAAVPIAPTTAQISPISYAAIQPIEPIKAKKQKPKTKNKKHKAKPTIDEDVWLPILGILGALVILGIYALLPIGAAVGVAWLWITSLSIQVGISLLVFIAETNAFRKLDATLIMLLGVLHIILFLIVFLIAVFTLYNNPLFWILSGLVVVIIGMSYIYASENFGI
jgi:hypothetical protein